jgi:RNA polymerase sigma-70 factor (ECF subfamily)
MVDPSESELLRRARAGDRGAYSSLVRMHHRKLFACAVRMVGDRDEAEDAVQESFLRAWRAIGRFDGRSELSTWLYRICINVCLNALRRRKRLRAADLADPRVPEPAADDTQDGVDPRGALEQNELHAKLAVALAELSPSLRTTVVLVLLQGMPHKEASAVLGCPEGTVAWRIHEARRRLRDRLREDAVVETPPLEAVLSGRSP